MSTFLPWLALLTEAFLIPFSSGICNSRTLLKTGITELEKQLILDSHNKLRQVVAIGQIHSQPPAANMAQLIWNDDLARRAQRWSATCSLYTHDPGRHRDDYLVGQNIATKWTTRVPRTVEDYQANWNADAISKWFREYASYHGGESSRTGHYTQIIWAETTMIGCGYSFYVDENNRYTKKYVCNYGPSGNVQGERPYRIGNPSCLQFGMGESSIFPGLCVLSANIHTSSSYPNYNNKPYNYNNYHPYFIGLFDFVH